MATLITHVYNEEFLLPYFIKHHQNIFDNFIVIYYESEDQTLNILRNLAPNWQVVPSRTENFDDIELHLQIVEIEKDIKGPKITLTVTEFFIGDPRLISQQLIIPSISLVNMSFDNPFDENKSFLDQRSHAVSSSGYFENLSILRDTQYKILLKNKLFLTSASGRSKSGRLIHSKEIKYQTGRHFYSLMPNNFLIVRVSNCFVNQKMIDRRLQIQNRLPKENSKLFKVHHSNFGKGLSIEDLMNVQEYDRSVAKDYSDEIQKRIIIMEASFSLRTSSDYNSKLLYDAFLAITNVQEEQQSSFLNQNVSESDSEIDIILSRLIDYKNISHKLKKLNLIFLNFSHKFSIVYKRFKTSLKR